MKVLTMRDETSGGLQPMKKAEIILQESNISNVVVFFTN